MTHRSCGLLGLLLLLYSCALFAQLPELDESSAQFVLVPELLHVGSDGKYSETHVVLFRVGCPAPNLSLEGDISVRITGAITQPPSVNHDKCTIWFDLKPVSTEHGTMAVQVLQGTKPIGYGYLHFADPAAKPVPTSPQVDVLWAPIGHTTCSKAFGRAVANNFWCIAVRIGNNSGYQLQIAGVGFKGKKGTSDENTRTPNSSYALTRAVAQEGATNSWRGYVINSVGGTALLMAGFAPYFHNARSAAKYNAGTAIVGGPLSAAINLLWPDTSVRTGNNLDDQSLRDGKLIPNNTQITTVVFLDRNSVSPDYVSACKALFKQYSDAPQDEVPFKGKNLKAVKEEIKRNEEDAVNDFDNCLVGGTSDGLKEALGDLVLVGDTIKYIQRIVVDQSVQSQEVPPGAQPTDSVVSYTSVSISAPYPERLPLSVIVRSGDKTQIAGQPKVAANQVTYTLPEPFRNPKILSYSITDLAGAIKVPLTGMIKDSEATITVATIKGNALTISGTKLLLLPDTLQIKVDGVDAPFEASKPSRLEDSATYSLTAAPDAKKSKTFTIMKADYLPSGFAHGTIAP